MYVAFVLLAHVDGIPSAHELIFKLRALFPLCAKHQHGLLLSPSSFAVPTEAVSPGPLP